MFFLCFVGLFLNILENFQEKRAKFINYLKLLDYSDLLGRQLFLRQIRDYVNVFSFLYRSLRHLPLVRDLIDIVPLLLLQEPLALASVVVQLVGLRLSFEAGPRVVLGALLGIVGNSMAIAARSVHRKGRMGRLGPVLQDACRRRTRELVSIETIALEVASEVYRLHFSVQSMGIRALGPLFLGRVYLLQGVVGEVLIKKLKQVQENARVVSLRCHPPQVFRGVEVAGE